MGFSVASLAYRVGNDYDYYYYKRASHHSSSGSSSSYYYYDDIHARLVVGLGIAGATTCLAVFQLCALPSPYVVHKC